MVKADDKVHYEEDDDADFTYFEELQKRVEVLQETLDEISGILRANNLVRIEEIDAPYFDEDEVYKRLEEN